MPLATVAMRFASAELQQQALAHEELCARPGILGRFLCFLGVVLTVVGLAAPVVSLDPLFAWARSLTVSATAQGQALEPTLEWMRSVATSLAGSSVASSSAPWTLPRSPTPQPPPPAPEPRRPPPPPPSWSWPVSPPPAPPSTLDWWPPPSSTKSRGPSYDSYGFEESSEVAEVQWLGADTSLLMVCVTLVAVCFLPSFLRWLVLSDPAGPPVGGMTRMPWASTPGHGGYAVVGGEVPVAARGGSGGGGIFGSIFGQPCGGQWGGARAGLAAAGMGDGACFWPPQHQRRASRSGSFGSWLGSMLAAFGSQFGFGNFGGWGLPSEAEVAETYAAVPQLPHWAAALASMLVTEVIDPLLRGLDASDRKLKQDLQQVGWHLVFHVPRARYYGGRMNDAHELSIFDTNLPQPLCSYPSAMTAWSHRQNLERFLNHPDFDRVAQREFVLNRLRDWQQETLFQRDLCSAMHQHGSATGDGMPSDCHILENILIRMFSSTFPEFGQCFVSPDGRAPPQGQHLGQLPSAWLRQVTSQQSRLAKPPPHYEVVTPARPWKLRPGNANMLEAVALLMHVLRTTSRSYGSFPANMRAAVEKAAFSPAAGGSGIPMY